MLNATSVEKYDGNVPKIELTDDHIGQTEYKITDIKAGKVEKGIVRLNAGRIILKIEDIKCTVEIKGRN